MLMKAYALRSGTAQIACYEKGVGMPLILLHGNGEDHNYFSGQVDVFARRYRVIAVDSRGHGQSTHGADGPLSIGQFAEDLRVILDKLKIQKAILLGFSDGGNVAISFALRYPERVEKLILNGANVRMLEGVVPWVQLPLYPAQHVLAALGEKGDRKAREKSEVLALMTQDYGVTLADLGRITCPALVVVGERDMIRREETAAIVHALPHAELETIEGGDHFCAKKAAGRFNLAVLQFLSKNK